MRTFCGIAIVVLVYAVPGSAQEAPSAADFDAQLAKLSTKATKDERLAVAAWLRKNFSSKRAPSAIPALEKLIRDDPEADVRRQAASALFYLVNSHDVDCPLALITALRDPVDEVRWEVSVMTGPYKKRMAPATLDALIAAVGDDRTDVRANCVLLLAHAAGKDAKARAAIEKAKVDRTFDVRHTAYCAWYIATNDLADFLTYMIRVREEPDAVLNPLPEGSEEAKTQLCMKNLFVLGSATRIIEWRNDRPDDLAAALVKLLDDKSAAMRRGAAHLVGASARRVELKQFDPRAPIGSGPNPLESLFPYIEPDAKLPKVAPAPPVLPSKAYGSLVNRKAVARLRYLATMDTDETVRSAARRSLERFAEIPEPLTIRPREVKP